MNTRERRNHLFFGLGTIGRDMFYAFQAHTLLFFLSDVLSLPVWVFAAVTMVLSALRIFDAVNDPFTGLVIDNIRSPWGKFKPAILVGGVLSALCSLVLFAGIGEGWTFVILFSLAYLFWDITYGINDIGYWTLLPVLSSDQKQKEKAGAFARICANIGLYIVMIGWQPVTHALGNTKEAWFGCAVVIAILYLLGLLFPLLGVHERRTAMDQQESTSLRQMLHALVKNDQLMWVGLSLALFMIGHSTTVNFAIYYMKYVFGNEGLYVVLVAVVGAAQLGSLIVYPAVAMRMSRRRMYTLSTILVLLGYAVFAFAEASLLLVAFSALLVFVGQAFIQTLMLMFLTDTVEYGHWKLGKRSEAVTFSIQPFIHKISGALSTGVVSLTLILSGIKIDGGTADAIGTQEQLILKIAMLALPLALIIAGYIIYLKKYKISESFYAGILKDLQVREAKR